MKQMMSTAKGFGFLLILTAVMPVSAALAFEFESRLWPIDGAQWARFGRAVAVSEDIVAVGANYNPRVRVEEGEDSTSGSVSVYRRTAEGWVFEQRLAPTDAGTHYPPTYRGGFGTALAISGDTIAVAAPGREDGRGHLGAVYIFTRPGRHWVQREIITSSDARPFATAIAMQGTTLVVGGLEDRLVWSGLSDAGLAYVFEQVGNHWVESAELSSEDIPSRSRLGGSLAIDENTIAIGARDYFFTSPGEVYLFARTENGWNQQTYLSRPADVRTFGDSVSIKGGTLAVGAPWGGDNSVFLYDRVGEDWVFQQQLTGGYRSGFGENVVLSDGPGGLELLVAAPRQLLHRYRYDSEHVGTVSLYARGPEGWGRQQIFSLGDNGRHGDGFGGSIDLKGNTVIVGVPGYGSYDFGTAYIYERP
jgi:hypothetical protein